MVYIYTTGIGQTVYGNLSKLCSENGITEDYMRIYRSLKTRGSYSNGNYMVSMKSVIKSERRKKDVGGK